MSAKVGAFTATSNRQLFKRGNNDQSLMDLSVMISTNDNRAPGPLDAIMAQTAQSQAPKKGEFGKMLFQTLKVEDKNKQNDVAKSSDVMMRNALADSERQIKDAQERIRKNSSSSNEMR